MSQRANNFHYDCSAGDFIIVHAWVEEENQGMYYYNCNDKNMNLFIRHAVYNVMFLSCGKQTNNSSQLRHRKTFVTAGK